MRPDELSSTATLFDLALPDLREKQNIPISERPGTGSARQHRPARDKAAAGTATKPSTTPGRPPRGQAAPAADPDGSPGPGQQVSDRLLDGLDTQQRAAATATGPLLILAGPGTGKTRTLTRRIGWLIATGQVAAEQCLAITFTRHAAQEMRDRLAALSVPQARQVTVTTFHGLGLQILRENTGLAGLDPGFGVADEAASLAAATELTGSASAGRRLATRARRDPAAQAELRGALAGRGLVDFDSLVELPAALLRREPAVAAALRERWPCVSVDEYQDIDATQYDLLHQLCAPAAPGAGLTVIGDPDQAIYGFRGSDVGFFLRFSEDFPGAATARLETNYRSAPDIVAGALQAVAPASLVPGRELRAAVAPATRAQPPAVLLHEAADEQAEADWIAAEIDRLLGGASFHSLDSGRADGQGHGGLGLADVAVLYRTDSQAKLLTQAFTRAGLPFQKRSHDRLAHRAGVPDLIREMSLTATEATSSSPAAGGLVRERLRAAVRKLTAWASPRVATDIQAAGEVLGPLADLCGDDLDHFLTEIAVGAEADALDDRAEAVPLLTIHAAKGLEFDVVFLAGCERGLLPLWLPGTEADEAEERRLLFVGMTRARARLLMSCAATRTRQGATRPAGPSPFLGAIDPGLLARPAPAAPRARPARQLRLL
jgi:superfamily I DNA/RNA helicase